MIHKEITKPSPRKTNKKLMSGYEAECQMAFYLKRSFGESKDVFVLNDLRLERNVEVAQIDHLVLHKHGMVIVESKSICGEVRVNEHLEFVYVYPRKKVGMPSPIQQAKRQGELLRALLIDHKEGLRAKKVFGIVQGGFQHCPIQVLVGISDQSIISRPKQAIQELHKADQIADQIEQIIARHVQGSKLTTAFDDGWGLYTLRKEELERVSAFLVERHTLLEAQQVEQEVQTASVEAVREPVVKKMAMPIYLCTHCQSTSLEIRYGKSYYFKCLDCDGNTGIKNVCSGCGKTKKTKKSGREFVTSCVDCDQSELFFVNPGS
jgi:hypothetical protein